MSDLIKKFLIFIDTPNQNNGIKKCFSDYEKTRKKMHKEWQNKSDIVSKATFKALKNVDCNDREAVCRALKTRQEIVKHNANNRVGFKYYEEKYKNTNATGYIPFTFWQKIKIFFKLSIVFAITIGAPTVGY
jgi:thioesterase domain-containing protein